MEKKTVLVVDDEIRMRKLVGITLRNHGFEILEAGDTGEAIDRMNQKMPDAIVLDAVLPHRTGFELCADLKSDARTADIPILIISGITQGVPGTSESWKRRFLADDYISKPFVLRDLVDRVERLVGTARRGVCPQ